MKHEWTKATPSQSHDFCDNCGLETDLYHYEANGARYCEVCYYEEMTATPLWDAIEKLKDDGYISW